LPTSASEAVTSVTKDAFLAVVVFTDYPGLGVLYKCLGLDTIAAGISIADIPSQQSGFK